MIFNNTYCKRTKYIKKYSFGRNNKGHITIRSRQGVFFKTTQLRNINYKYIFRKDVQSFLASGRLIKLQIVKRRLNSKLQRYIYIVVNLNSISSGQYKYLPITKNTSVGDIIYIGEKAPLKVGNIMAIKQIPCGS